MEERGEEDGDELGLGLAAEVGEAAAAAAAAAEEGEVGAPCAVLPVDVIAVALSGELLDMAGMSPSRAETARWERGGRYGTRRCLGVSEVRRVGERGG